MPRSLKAMHVIRLCSDSLPPGGYGRIFDGLINWLATGWQRFGDLMWVEWLSMH